MSLPVEFHRNPPDSLFLNLSPPNCRPGQEQDLLLDFRCQVQQGEDPLAKVLDPWTDFTQANGTVKPDLFTPDKIHPSPAGYAVYAERLKPLLAGRTVAAFTEPCPLSLLLKDTT